MSASIATLFPAAPQPKTPRLYTEAEVTRMLAAVERAAIATVMACYGIEPPAPRLSVVRP